MLDPINKSSHGQVRDILIAETAIKNAAVLVTADSNLRQVVSEFGGHALSIKDIEPE
jgi:predicted nucleic acid-binding protein